MQTRISQTSSMVPCDVDMKNKTLKRRHEECPSLTDETTDSSQRSDDMSSACITTRNMKNADEIWKPFAHREVSAYLFLIFCN